MSLMAREWVPSIGMVHLSSYPHPSQGREVSVDCPQILNLPIYLSSIYASHGKSSVHRNSKVIKTHHSVKSIRMN